MLDKFLTILIATADLEGDGKFTEAEKDPTAVLARFESREPASKKSGIQTIDSALKIREFIQTMLEADKEAFTTHTAVSLYTEAELASLYHEGLTSLDIYLWIYDDPNDANQTFTYAKDLSLKSNWNECPQEDSEETCEQGDSEKPTDLKTELNQFLYLTKDLPNLNKEALKTFLVSLEEQGREFPSFHTQATQVFKTHNKLLQDSPWKGEQIIKSLLIALKAFLIIYPTPTLTFDENEAIDYFFQNEPQEKSEILSNTSGRITGLTLFLSEGLLKNEVNEEDYFNPIAHFLWAKRAEKDFRLKCVYTNIKDLDALLNYLRDFGIENPENYIVGIPAEDITPTQWTVWSRDGAVQMTNKSIVESPYSRHEQNFLAYNHLALAEGRNLSLSPLIFEGGNLRSNDRYLFVGADDIYYTALKMRDLWETYKPFAANVNHSHYDYFEEPFHSQITPLDIENAIIAFSETFGKEVVPIGLEKDAQGKFQVPKTYQNPFYFHIDLLITPISDTEIVMGGISGTWQRPWEKAVKEALKTQGFTVHEIPIAEISTPDQRFTLSYNNVLIEDYVGTETCAQRVFLPQYYIGNPSDPDFEGIVYSYDLAGLNNTAAQTYARLGFEVVPIPIPVELAKYGGALDCLTFEDREEEL